METVRMHRGSSLPLLPDETQMMKELNTVVLTTDLLEHGLKAGDLGTVVLVHEHSGYEMELV
jgi:hypothetical protein